MTDIIYIYGLKETDSDEIRYVGQSHDVKARRYDHVHGGECKHDHPKTLWIENAKRRGVDIEFVILEACSFPDVDAVEREQYWIDNFSLQGHRLTNVQPATRSILGKRRSVVIGRITVPEPPVEKIVSLPLRESEEYQPSAYSMLESQALDLVEMNMKLLEMNMSLIRDSIRNAIAQNALLSADPQIEKIIRDLDGTSKGVQNDRQSTHDENRRIHR